MILSPAVVGASKNVFVGQQSPAAQRKNPAEAGLFE
jgi:hypothetical protein